MNHTLALKPYCVYVTCVFVCLIHACEQCLVSSSKGLNYTPCVTRKKKWTKEYGNICLRHQFARRFILTDCCCYMRKYSFILFISSPCFFLFCILIPFLITVLVLVLFSLLFVSFLICCLNSRTLVWKPHREHNAKIKSFAYSVRIKKAATNLKYE